jgi:hypothetical protein
MSKSTGQRDYLYCHPALNLHLLIHGRMRGAEEQRSRGAEEQRRE